MSSISKDLGAIEKVSLVEGFTATHVIVLAIISATVTITGLILRYSTKRHQQEVEKHKNILMYKAKMAQESRELQKRKSGQTRRLDRKSPNGGYNNVK